MTDNYAAPSGPPPNYGSQHNHPQNTGSTAAGGQIVPYNNQTDLRAPDPVHGGYSSPPPGGYYAPNNNNSIYNQPAYGPPLGGYYAPNDRGAYGPPHPPPQQMYYAAPYGPQPGYYQDHRRTGAGSGICAGVLAALACCCCLDFIF